MDASHGELQSGAYGAGHRFLLVSLGFSAHGALGTLTSQSFRAFARHRGRREAVGCARARAREGRTEPRNTRKEDPWTSDWRPGHEGGVEVNPT